VALAAMSFVLVPRLLNIGGSDIEVRSGNSVIGRFQLDRDQTIEVAGPLGPTSIRVEHGRAHIVSSPCPNKTCIKMGDVGKEGGIVICVPNEVLIRVGNGRSDDIDAVSR
jgi:hypothetical protein